MKKSGQDDKKLRMLVRQLSFKMFKATINYCIKETNSELSSVYLDYLTHT